MHIEWKQAASCVSSKTLLALLCGTGIGLASCEQAEDTTEDAVEQAEDAAEEAGDAVEDAADEVGDAIEDPTGGAGG
ncbi:MAG: YtxH domain-containing protein [Planctomycetota bacterium]